MDGVKISVSVFRTPTVGTKAAHEKITQEGSVIGYLHMAKEVWTSYFSGYDGTSRRAIEAKVAVPNSVMLIL